MSENINFIPANELPVAEGDEVSVLCLEDGEMKQKPANGLGGEQTDLVLKLEAPFHFGGMTADKCAVTIERGSVGAVVAALEAGRHPVVKVHRFYDTGANEGMDIPNREGGVYDCSVLHYGDHIHFMFTIPGRGGVMMQISMAPEDPDYLEVWQYPLAYTTIQVI